MAPSPLVIRAPELRPLTALAVVQKGGLAYYRELIGNSDPIVASGAWCALFEGKLVPRPMAAQAIGACRYGAVRARAFAYFTHVHEHALAKAAAETPAEASVDLEQAAMLAELARDNAGAADISGRLYLATADLAHLRSASERAELAGGWRPALEWALRAVVVAPLNPTTILQLFAVLESSAQPDLTEEVGEILRARTSVEPADPVGLDLERDEPRLYPLIYWPVTATQPALSPRAQAALDRYLRTGGIIFIDTRDQQMSFDRPAGGNPDLKRLLAGVETPPLVAMPPDHVLSRAFYLLSDMPGRWQGGKLWIESGGGRVNDGVTTVLIGSNDYAGAWATDQRGRGLLPVTPGGETQREMSYRFGVNLVMHALTGNYKDDQVHLPDIMQRLRR